MKTMMCGIPKKDLISTYGEIAFKKGKKYYGDDIYCLKDELSNIHSLGVDWQKEFIFTVEDVWEDGDILMTKHYPFIFKEEKNGKIYCHAFSGVDYCDNGWACNSNEISGLASKEQQQKLFNQLKNTGKVWNPEKKCIEDLQYEPKRGEVVKTANYMYIFNGKNESGYNTALNPILIFNKGNLLTPNNFWTGLAEPTTPEERRIFFEALTKAGYKYNSKKIELTKVEPGFDFSKLKRGDFLTFKTINVWFVVFDRIENSRLYYKEASSGICYLSSNKSWNICEIDQSTIKVLNREI